MARAKKPGVSGAGQQEKSDQGKREVRAAIADAEPAVSPMLAADDPPFGAALGELAPGGWHEVADALGLPPDCPVVPLGTSEGRYFFLNPLGELRVLTESSFGQSHIQSLFAGRSGFLYWAWPNISKKDGIERFRAEKTREDLMNACARKGVWDLVEKVRGRGAWLGRDGTLIVHCGDRLVIDGKLEIPGERDGFIYPHRNPIPSPWPIEVQENPCRELLPLLRSWEWVRPEVDPILLLGWIGAAMIGGALPWRPAVFVTGDSATGKSTLQQVLKELFRESLLQSTDTTAAGISQRLQQDSLPVAIDELEADADPRKAAQVIDLAKIASQGSVKLRGGDRHTGVEFEARSCFLFSAVNPPALSPQVLSRMAILRLRELPAKAKPPKLGDFDLDVMGRKIMRRLLDNWHRFGNSLEAYREELYAGGHSGRGQDTFGVLLACADLLVGEDFDKLGVPMGEDLTAWRDLLKAETLSELEDAAPNWLDCLSHLLAVPVEAWRSGQRQVAGAVLEAFFTGAHGADKQQTITTLNQAGLSMRQRGKDAHDWWLVVPSKHPATRALFEGSPWANGAWKDALRQAPEDVFAIGQCRIQGVKSKATFISLPKLYGEGGVMEMVSDDQNFG